MAQTYIVIKNINTSDGQYRLGDVIKATSADTIKPLLEQDAALPMRKAFEWQYKVFCRWLLRYPLDVQGLKDCKPELYSSLMGLYNTIDRHWLRWDYKAFVEAIEAYKLEHLSVYLSFRN